MLQQTHTISTNAPLGTQHSSAAFFTVARPPPSSSYRGRLQVLSAVKRIVEKHVACSKTLIALEGEENKVDALCTKIAEYAQQRAAEDRSAGILTFQYGRDAQDPRVFHFWEVYESNTALGKLNTSPEVMKFMETVNDHLEAPLGMALYEMKDGKIGPVCVQGGPKGEGGLDDATGATGAAGGASYKQTSASVDLTNVKEKDDEERGLWGIKFELPWMKKKTN